MDYAEIVRPAAGVQVINNIREQPGVSTIEGRLGPLIFGDSTQTYFLDIPSGAFLEQHPHPFEALIYAVRGSFIVSSLDKRYLVKPGGLMSFADNVPTGYEVPFDEPAYMLVFRGTASELDQTSFVAQFEEEHPARLLDLPEDHPARVYAREINSAFG